MEKKITNEEVGYNIDEHKATLIESVENIKILPMEKSYDYRLLKIDFLLKMHQMFSIIKNLFFHLKCFARENYLKFKDLIYISGVTKRDFNFSHHDMRRDRIVAYKRRENPDAETEERFSSFYDEDNESITINNRKKSIYDKIFQTSRIVITDLLVDKGINNKDYINLKTERYERTERIKGWIIVFIGGVIGALCVCFGWMATILLKAWERHDINYLLDEANYISYVMTTLFIIGMLILFYIKNRFLDKTGIIADIDQITGVKNDPSACWKLIDSDKFKESFLVFLKKILDDNQCTRIILLDRDYKKILERIKFLEKELNEGKKNDNIMEEEYDVVTYKETLADDITKNALYIDKRDEIQNRILSVLKNFSNFFTCNNNSSNENEGSRLTVELTITTDQIHKIFEILMDYKNYVFVRENNGKEERYDVSFLLKTLLKDLSHPNANPSNEIILDDHINGFEMQA